MALDEAILEAVRQNLSPPTLRLYQWDKPSISIGYFQKVSDINIDYCRRKGYPLVRRLTGGRAILHDSEITYSFSARTSSHLSADRQAGLFKGRLHEDYTIISNAMILGLKLSGIDAQITFSRKKKTRQKSSSCFKAVSFGEVTVDGKKVIGSAQKRYSNGFLQHGSMLLDFNAKELRNVLKCNNEEDFKDIGYLKEHADKISINDINSSLKKAFETVIGVKMISDDLTKFELKLAKELELKKYSTQKWNFRR